MIVVLLVWAGLLVLFHWSAVVANLFFYRRKIEGTIDPITVIKPMKGDDVGLEANLRALVDAGDRNLQVIFALESKDDPAYPAAKRVADSTANAEVELVITGPSGDRMGKVHNMIEALPHARHPIVVFSDADTVADRSLLVETCRLFREGADTVWATPYEASRTGLGAWLMAAVMNHGFSIPGALCRKLGVFRSFSGGWMAFRRDVLMILGDLKPFERVMVDDYSIGTAAVRKGARPDLSRRIVLVREQASDMQESGEHLWKWLKMVRHAAPHLYSLILLCNSVFAAALALAAARLTNQHLEAARTLFILACFLRVAGAIAQDRKLHSVFPFFQYLLLPAIDIAQIVPWTAALFTRHVTWRGKLYRLVRGGKVEVVA